MHIIIGFLGSVITILWLLHRLAEMGIDLFGLNPFLWQRRRRWRKNYEANPIYKVEHPMDATALLVVAVAKADGDMSVEEKKAILSLFEREFELPKREAAGLFISSTHLLGTGEELRTNLKGVLAPSLAKFTLEQAQSAIELMRRIAQVGGPSEAKTELIGKAAEELAPRSAPAGKWSSAV
jgi:uncharacterized tellurite resistance protein B-like protein